MKKIILLICLTFSVSVGAAGPNDGVYSVTDGNGNHVSFSSIHQNGDIVVTVGLESSSFTWVASQGIRVGNVVELVTVAGPGTIIETVEFTGDNTAVSTVVSCQPDPGFFCTVVPGEVVFLTKVF